MEDVYLCYLCRSEYDKKDCCFFLNKQLSTHVCICSKCIEYAVDDDVKKIWYSANPDHQEWSLYCPYCKESAHNATYECLLIKQNVRFSIMMHAGCFEENIGIGL